MLMMASLALTWLPGDSRGQSAPGYDGSVAAVLARANHALTSGDFAGAAQMAGPIARSVQDIDSSDRAEAWRLLGLAQFYLGQSDQARQSFYAYLRLEPDGHLDPQLVPPDAVLLFDSVRSEHAAELAALRPKAPAKRYWLLNLVPGGGQFQNGQRTKGLVLAGASTALFATSVTTYLLLHNWCGGSGDTCDSGEPGEPDYRDNTGKARAAFVINMSSSALLLGVYAYSVYDGFRGYYREQREPSAQTADTRWSAGVTDESVWFGVSGSFR